MEINFERGGTLPKKKIKLSKTSIFGAKNEETLKKKKPKHEKKKGKTGENEEGTMELRSVNALTLSSLVPDMILMAIVKSVHPDRLFVSLPGRLFGRVPITNISKAYTEFLSSTVDGEDLLDKPKTLSEMFHVGQVLYTKVVDKCDAEKQDIVLSLVPEDINSELSKGTLEKGSVMMCAIEEVEDHGYFLETGIKGVRGFLPKKNSKSDETRAKGELLYCKVQKVTASITTFVPFKKGEQIKVDTADVPNIKALLPSTFVSFNVVQLLKNGIEGLLFDGTISAYANELYIPPKLNADPKIIGKELKARILYRMPLTNHLYVTLNVDESTANGQTTFGKIEDAKVLKQTSTGVLFKLESGECAFLPRKAIIKSYKNNFDVDTAMLKFSPNSTHTIRIMSFNDFERCYLCTNDEKLLKEKYFGTYDLQIGQLVQAKVEAKFGDGLKLAIGNVKGFLKGLLYQKTAKCEVGSIVKVRVVEIEHSSRMVQVTNLQGFLRDGCKILDTKGKIKVGESFLGVVMTDTTHHFTVLFFNHFKGILLKNEQTQVDIVSIGGLKVGSVKMFEIERVRRDKIFLKIPKKIDTQNLGKAYECKVTSILPTSGVQIYINELKSYGKIPIHLLSEFNSLNEPILSSMRENQKFQVVALGNNEYSRRDVKYFSKPVPTDFKDVNPNDVLRCYVKSVKDNSIELECPLRNFNETIRLHRDAFDDPELLILKVGDIVYVNVIAKSESHSNSLYVTPSLTKVWRSNDESLDMLSNYLNDISILIENLKELERPCGKYSIGQRVSGTVRNIIGNNVLIEVEDGVFAQGSVENVNNYKVGSKINEAVVVWIDPIRQMLFITTVGKCKDEISIEQEADEKLVNERKKHKAIIIYFNEYVTVCTIRKTGQPLIYVPTKHHYNDFTTSNSRALGNAMSKLIIKKVSHGKMLGVFAQDAKIFQKIEKIKTKVEQKIPMKRKMTSSISESITEGETTMKHPKVVLEDSSDDEGDVAVNDENSPDKKEDTIKGKSNNSNNTTLRKQAKDTLRTIGKKAKKVAKMPLPGKKHFINKDSILDEEMVNLVSYKKIKEGQTSTVVEKKHEKFTTKSTIGKIKKPKRLLKKK